MSHVFLTIKDVYKTFGGVHALNGVDLEIRSGEIHCLAGENGSGKSTLIKIISGIYQPDKGQIRIEGSEVQKLTPRDSINAGIQVIYQDFAIFPNLSVAENISINHSVMTAARRMNWREARALAIEAMNRIGAKLDPEVLVESLSVANKQMVAICRAIINDAKLLILDEPTASLTAKEVDALNEIIRNLRDKDMAIMIVNHKIDEIFNIAERITVLRNGEKISSGPAENYTRQSFIHDLTGRDISESTYAPAPSEEEIFRVENLSRTGEFADVSFELRKGDVLGITGLLGSGRGQIGDALFGVAPATSGKIFLNGEEIKIRSIDDAIQYRIGYVPEDRLTQGLFLNRSIQENTTAASIRKYFVNGRVDQKMMLNDTIDWIRKIGCNAKSAEPPIRTLSGGNAQKMVIAKWLNTQPRLLILNGPTVGVDIGAKADIHHYLHTLAADGVGVIVISDDLAELIQNCNRIIVMKDGKAVSTVCAKDVDETALSRTLSD